jgi:hypothetical protein
VRALADRPGGRADTTTNAIAGGLYRLAADARLQYVLAYTSPAPADGRFHQISVRVRRPGARVRARSGFRALSADEMRRVPPPPRPADASVLSALATTVPAGTFVRTWVGTARGERGGTRVTLAWELVPAAPGERRDTPRRVAVSAAVRGGATIYSSEDGPGVLPVDGREPHSVSFDAPPGVLALRVAVYGNEDVLDVESRAVEVPAYEARSISTPAVYAARSAAELRTIRSNPARAPAVRREFSRTEQLLVRFESYAADSALPRADLLNQAGERLHDLTVAAGQTPGSHEITTGVSHLAIGDYVLEIVLGSDPETRTLVPIKVRQ